MGWVRVSDDAPLHPKLHKVGLEGLGLWLAALCYCNRTLSDGYISCDDLALLYPASHWRQTRRILAVITSAGLLHKDGTGYRIHDYHHYQPTAEKIKHLREIRSVAGRVGGQRASQAKAKQVAFDVLQAKSNPNPNPNPNVVPRRNYTPSSPPQGDEAFASFWSVYPRRVGKAAARQVWRTLHPTAELTATILAAVQAQATCPQWTKDGGQFIPHPATWLKQGRWEDDLAQTNGHAHVTDKTRRTVANLQHWLETEDPAHDAAR